MIITNDDFKQVEKNWSLYTWTENLSLVSKYKGRVA